MPPGEYLLETFQDDNDAWQFRLFSPRLRPVMMAGKAIWEIAELPLVQGLPRFDTKRGFFISFAKDASQYSEGTVADGTAAVIQGWGSRH